MSASPALTHRKRIEVLLAGEICDRTPVALWRHFPVADQDPDELAKATIDFQERFDFDLIKLTPSSSFQVGDWGVRDEWRGNPEGSRDYTARVIHKPEDWSKIRPHSASRGLMVRQRDCAKAVSAHFDHNTPVLQTVFSPLSQAKNLAGNDLLIRHLRQTPERLTHALEAITETTINFVSSLLDSGIDGVFFAVQHAQYGLLSESEFNDFGRKYDLMVLEHCQALWCNMVHIHGENVQFHQVHDYPVQIFNWHDQTTPPSLVEGLAQVKGAVCGGLHQWQTMVLGSPEDVQKEARKAIRDCRRRRLLLGTGCVTPITAPEINLLSARRSVED